ncbi:SDR family oxidoreductase [Chloroflexota bacterium]
MSNVIVVTGASSGVGLEIVKRFVDKKWSVIGLARNKDKLESIKNTVDGKYSYYTADIRDNIQVSKAFNEIQKHYGKIDILINNASVFKQEEFIECDAKDINNIIDTNLKGTMFCTHETIKLMKGNGGRIINIASVAATHGIINQAIYCASKYGIDGFAEALSQELIEEGILISTIYPGGIDTALWNEETNPYLGDLSKVLKPEDIVDMVEYIANLPGRVVLKKVVVFPSNEWH